MILQVKFKILNRKLYIILKKKNFFLRNQFFGLKLVIFADFLIKYHPIISDPFKKNWKMILKIKIKVLNRKLYIILKKKIFFYKINFLN